MEFNVLLVNPGKDVDLTRNFYDSFVNFLGSSVGLFVVNEGLAPSSYVSDRIKETGRVTNPGYINGLLEICKQWKIDLLVPCSDRELPLLAKYRKAFSKIGTWISTSSSEFNDMCNTRESALTCLAKVANVPRYLDSLSGGLENFLLPIFPMVGRSSLNREIPDVVLNSELEIEAFLDREPSGVVIEIANGRRYEIDCFVGIDRQILAIVPRLQTSTEYGSIQKTEKNSLLSLAAKHVLNSLPAASGCVTLECFVNDRGEIYWLDLIGRFTGSYSLSYQAGADFPFLVYQIMQGLSPDPTESWSSGLRVDTYPNYFYQADQIERIPILLKR
jgi:carbamoyl-phosphate synthase large subunit